MGESLGIVLFDAQPLFLDALRATLVGRGHHVLATTTSHEQVLSDVERLRPDLCILDSKLADGDGIELIDAMTTRSPRTKVVVLTEDGRESVMRRALDAGARGFAHKSRGLAALLRMLERVAGGETCVLISRPPNGLASGQCQRDQMRHLASFLTPREAQCLTLLAGGLDTVQIARRLGVSTATVRSHIQAVLNKLGARTRLAAVTLAIRHGLLVEDDALHAARGA